MGLQAQTLKGLKWTSIETIGVRCAQFIIGIVLARLLTPADYGIIGIIAVFIAIASAFIDSGFSNALIRKKEASEVDFSTTYIFNIIISVFFYILLAFGAPFIAEFYNQPELTNIVRVISINLIIGSLAAVQKVKIARDLNFKLSAKCSTSATIISGLVGIALAYSGRGVWALVFQQVANTTLNTLFLSVWGRWKPSFVFSQKSFHELWGYGSKLLASGLLHTIYTQFTSIVIGKFYSISSLGFYTRGQQLPDLLSSNFLSVISKVVFPIFAKIQDDEKRLINAYIIYIKATSIIIIFALLLLLALAKPTILFLLTDKWTDAIPFLEIFCLIYLTDHINIINLNLLQVIGRSDLFLRLEIIKKVISISMIIAAIPFGVMAICISRLIYSQIALVFNTYYTGKLFHLGYIKQLKCFIPYIIYSLIAVAPAFLVTYIPLHQIVKLIVGSILSLTIYIFILNLRKDSVWLTYILPNIKKRIPFLG